MSALTTLQVGSPISYLIAVAAPAQDAIVPVVPSETAVIALGVHRGERESVALFASAELEDLGTDGAGQGRKGHRG